MAVTYFTGFESAAAGLDGITLTGTAAYSTVQARTGSRSIRCNPASGASGYIVFTAFNGWIHFGLYIATLPSVNRSFGNLTSVITLTSAGKISYKGVSSTATLSTGQWYWIGVRAVQGAYTGAWLQVNGVDDCVATAGPVTTASQLGFNGTDASAVDAYIDDVVIDGAGFIAASKVIDLLPTADSAIGTGWTLGSGGTSNLFGGVDNQPPTAVADAGTTAQIRNATANANSNYDATLQTYTVGGVGGSDTILAVQNVIATAAPVTTSAKLGKVGNVSNPAITTIDLAAGGTAAAFWSGVAAGTYPTGWKVSTGTLTTSPSITVGTAPVMRVTQVTSSTRIAMVAYMALRVAWTPVSGSATVTPTTVALVATKFAPTVTASDNQLVTPSTAALTSATFAPTVGVGIVVTVPTAGGYVKAVKADSPTSYWRLGESSGTTAADEMGSNPGTYVNSPTLGAAGALSGSNTAVTFNGTNQNITVASSSPFRGTGTVAFSIEAWVKHSATGHYRQIASAMDAGNGWEFYHFDNGSSKELALYRLGYASVTGGTATLGTTWHHIVGTYDGTNIRLYLDGALVNTSGTVVTSLPSTSTFKIGGDTVFWNGELDEVAFYPTALSADRILAHYDARTSSNGLILTTFAPTVTATDTQLVTPTTKSLTLATFAPTVTATDFQLVTPTTKALSLATFAPAVNTPERATPSTVSLVLTTFAPTVTATELQLVTPTTATLAFTIYAPTVTAPDPQLITPTTAALTLTPFAPTATAAANQQVVPSTAALILQSFAPTVSATANEAVTPTTKALTLTTFAPSVAISDNQAVVPTTRAATLTTFAPTVTASDKQLVTPLTATLTATKFAPTATATDTLLVTPTTRAVTLATFAPTVSFTAHQTLIPTTVSLTVTTFAPTVAATAHQTLVPTTAALSLAPQVPTAALSDHQRVTPTTHALALTTYPPTTTPTDDIVAIPTTKALALTTYAPTVTTPDPQLVTVPKASLTLTPFAPAAATPQTVTPTTRALALTTFAPTVTTTSLATPMPVALTLTAYIPTVSTPLAAVPTTAGLVTATYAPNVAATAHQVATPTTRALTLTTYAPAAVIGTVAVVAPSSLTISSFAPTVTAGTNTYAFPDPASLTLTGYAPLIDLSAFKLVTPATAALVLTTYPPTAEQHSLTPLPYPIYGFAIVALGDSAGVGTAQGGATVRSVEEGSTTASTSGPSARVTIR